MKLETLRRSAYTSILCAGLSACSAPDTTGHGSNPESPAVPAATTPPAANAAPGAPANVRPPDDLEAKLRVLDTNVYRVPVEGFPSIGSADALVTVVFFSDYDCPFCHRLEGELDSLREEHAGDVRVVYAPRPLPMHPRARPAALAALAGAAQGRFAEIHRRLLDGRHDEEGLLAAATDAKLDLGRFEIDRKGAEVEKILASSTEIASRFSVHGTPTVFVNGRRITGAQRDLVRRLVEDQLTLARSTVASGAPRRTIYDALTGRGLELAGRDPSVTLLPRPFKL